MTRLNREKRKQLTKEAYNINGVIYKGEFPPLRVNRETKNYIKDYWETFLQFDNPWYSNFIELTVMKTVQMRMHLVKWDGEDADQKILKAMDEVISLGYKLIYDNAYYDKWDNWIKENSRKLANIYKKTNDDTLNYSDMTPLTTIYGCDVLDTVDENSVIKSWLKNNNVSYNEVHIVYSSEWTNDKDEKENQKYSKKLYRECYNDYKKDKDKYFKLLSKYCYEFNF